MSEERRANPNPMDISGALAALYTIAYMVMVGLLFFVSIPAENKDLINTLVGIMSAVQMAIIGFFFGSSKNAEATQRATEQRSARTESVLQETIRAVPKVAAAVAGAPLPDMQVTADTVNVTETPDPGKVCPNCKAVNPPDAAYCRKCGTKQPLKEAA